MVGVFNVNMIYVVEFNSYDLSVFHFKSYSEFNGFWCSGIIVLSCGTDGGSIPRMRILHFFHNHILFTMPSYVRIYK